MLGADRDTVDTWSDSVFGACELEHDPAPMCCCQPSDIDAELVEVSVEPGVLDSTLELLRGSSSC